MEAQLDCTKISEQAISLYIRLMSEATMDIKKPLNGFELKNVHFESRLKAIDFFRINNQGLANHWRLERDLECLFDEIRTSHRQQSISSNFVDTLERRGSRGRTLI